jgi:Co/Zn/Cd efflux system component
MQRATRIIILLVIDVLFFFVELIVGELGLSLRSRQTFIDDF